MQSNISIKGSFSLFYDYTSAHIVGVVKIFYPRIHTLPLQRWINVIPTIENMDIIRGKKALLLVVS